jgi:hypothetical protein
MSATVDITGWHPERVAGFVEAIRGDHPSVEIEAVLRHHDPDQVGQLSMSLSDEPASDLVIHECQQCQTVTVAKVLSLASLGAPMALSPAGKSDDEPERTTGTQSQWQRTAPH